MTESLQEVKSAAKLAVRHGCGEVITADDPSTLASRVNDHSKQCSKGAVKGEVAAEC